MTDRRNLFGILLASLSLCLLLACAAKAIGRAEAYVPDVPAAIGDPGGMTEPDAASPDLASGVARWWETGALAAPVAALVFVLLIGIEHVGAKRWRWVAWMRIGRYRSAVSLSLGGVTTLLPAIATSSVTWGGLCVALLGGLLALRPGGEMPKPEAEAPT